MVIFQRFRIRRLVSAGTVLLAGFLSSLHALTIQENVPHSFEGNNYRCDVVAWTDANGRARSAWLIRSDGDVSGWHGGTVIRYTYFIDNTQRVAEPNNAMYYPSLAGFGASVSHHSNASWNREHATNATSGFVFKGQSHAVWRIKGDIQGDGKSVGNVVDYFFSDGRTEIGWATSYDTSRYGGTEVNWDARGPYFQTDWDGDGQFAGGAISGIRWGDRFKFRTVNYNGAASTWDYSQPNTIPYMMLWKAAGTGGLGGNVECGVVQTQTWTQQDAGGYWWAGGAGGTTGSGMPENWNLPFQLNAYEGFAGEKMAWGTNYGYVGQAQYDTLAFAPPRRKGHPFQGYAVQIVINKFSEGLTDAVIRSMEAAQATALTATTGRVITSGPHFAGIAAETYTYQPAGWDHIYGVWVVEAAGNAAAINWNVGQGTMTRPVIVVSNYTAAAPPSLVTFNGAPLAAADYSASVDTVARRLWITLNRNLSGAQNAVAFGPGGADNPPSAPRGLRRRSS